MAKELKARTEIKKKLTESALTLATNLPDSFAGVPLILTGWQGLIG